MYINKVIADEEHKLCLKCEYCHYEGSNINSSACLFPTRLKLLVLKPLLLRL